MIDSKVRHGSRLTKVLGGAGIAVLLLASACSSDSGQDFNPRVTADQDRGSSGALEKLTVKGKHFTPSGKVLVTVAMAATGGNASPYLEETIDADQDGHILFERQPVPCPQPKDYQRGSFILVIARDMTTGISGSTPLNPGDAPDCTG
jgi:hypothetical protein